MVHTYTLQNRISRNTFKFSTFFCGCDRTRFLLTLCIVCVCTKPPALQTKCVCITIHNRIHVTSYVTSSYTSVTSSHRYYTQQHLSHHRTDTIHNKLSRNTVSHRYYTQQDLCHIICHIIIHICHIIAQILYTTSFHETLSPLSVSWNPVCVRICAHMSHHHTHLSHHHTCTIHNRISRNTFPPQTCSTLLLRAISGISIYIHIYLCT